MPRTKNELKQETLSKLKTQILEKSGIKLTRPSDCDGLSHHVWQTTNHLINPITFKRIYGFVMYPFNPSFQTLNILSQYLGYNDWFDFEQKSMNYNPISENELNIYLSFFEFDSINKIEGHDGGIQSISRKIAKRFQEDPETFKKIIPKLARNQFAHTFFIEHFPDYDNLVEYYYLLFEEYLKNNKTIEGQLYGNCMLFLKALWTNNTSDVNVIFEKIESTILPDNIHPYLIGRFFSSKLYFHFFFGDQSQTNLIISDFFDRTEKLPVDGKHFWDFPAAYYIFCEALFLTKQYQRCISLIEEAFSKFPIRTEFIRKGYYRQLQLFCYLSKCKFGKNAIENKFILKMNPDNYYFISKRHFSVYFYWAKYLSNKNIENLNKARKIADLNKNKLLINLLALEL